MSDYDIHYTTTMPTNDDSNYHQHQWDDAPAGGLNIFDMEVPDLDETDIKQLTSNNMNTWQNFPGSYYVPNLDADFDLDSNGNNQFALPNTQFTLPIDQYIMSPGPSYIGSPAFFENKCISSEPLARYPSSNASSNQSHATLDSSLSHISNDLYQPGSPASPEMFHQPPGGFYYPASGAASPEPASYMMRGSPVPGHPVFQKPNPSCLPSSLPEGNTTNLPVPPTSRPRSHSSTSAAPIACPHCPSPKTFKRRADLTRHITHMHTRTEDLTIYPCDYPRCTRRHEPFYRRDHFRDHLRDFHQEDLTKRGTDEGAGWYRERNTARGWWRCSRCLTRVSVNRSGFECPDCGGAAGKMRQVVRARATLKDRS